MTPLITEPICCNPLAFAAMKEIAGRMDADDALFRGSIAISRNWNDDGAVPCGRRINEIATSILKRVRGVQPQAMFARLHEALFEEHNLTCVVDQSVVTVGDTLLPTAVKTMRAVPTVAGIIYKLVSNRLGFCSWFHAIPRVGHYMTVVYAGDAIVLDLYNGFAQIHMEELQADVAAANVEWSDAFVQPQENRAWLTGSMQALLQVLGAARNYHKVAAVLELEMLIWPEHSYLMRDLGLVLARIGERGARDLLCRYLEGTPEDPQASDLRDLLSVLEA